MQWRTMYQVYRVRSPVTLPRGMHWPFTGWQSSAFTSITDTCGTSGGASDTYSVKSSTVNYTKGALGYTLVGASKPSASPQPLRRVGRRRRLPFMKSLMLTDPPVVSSQYAINYQNNPGSGTDAVTSGTVSATQSNTYIFGTTYGSESGGFSPEQDCRERISS